LYPYDHRVLERVHQDTNIMQYSNQVLY
jgi:hypothetical protein